MFQERSFNKTYCKDCGKECIWRKTNNDKWVLVDTGGSIHYDECDPGLVLITDTGKIVRVIEGLHRNYEGEILHSETCYNREKYIGKNL